MWLLLHHLPLTANICARYGFRTWFQVSQAHACLRPWEALSFSAVHGQVEPIICGKPKTHCAKSENCCALLRLPFKSYLVKFFGSSAMTGRSPQLLSDAVRFGCCSSVISFSLSLCPVTPRLLRSRAFGDAASAAPPYDFQWNTPMQLPSEACGVGLVLGCATAILVKTPMCFSMPLRSRFFCSSPKPPAVANQPDRIYPPPSELSISDATILPACIVASAYLRKA